MSTSGSFNFNNTNYAYQIPPGYTQKQNYYIPQSQPTITFLQQQNVLEENKGPYWEYLKTGSFIVRLILIIFLIIGLVLIVQASLLNILIELNGYEETYLKDYLTILKLLRTLFITFTAVLLAIQVVKICLNVANLGDYKPSPNSTAKCIHILLAVGESLLFIALVSVAGFFAYVGVIILYFDSDFGIAIIMVFVSAIWRSILGCVECCCKPRQYMTPPMQPMVVMMTRP